MPHRGFAHRTEHLTAFKVVDFLDAAIRRQQAGEDIIRMEAGEPAFDLPPRVHEAARQALERGSNRYTPSLGIDPLREAIARFTSSRYGIEVPARRIVVTTGSSAALGMICDLLINPGDTLLLADPGYPCNANFVRRCGGIPVRIPVSAQHRFQLSAGAVAAHWRDTTAGLLIASPSNPTGEVVDRDTLSALHREVATRGGALIVDEIYHGLTYETGADFSVLNLTDDVYVINSFSKYFAMPGWRLGWAVLPDAALEPVRLMTQNFYISPPSIAQQAALAAFHPESLAIYESRREELKTRRDFLVPALRELGFDISHTPAGAFYIYAGIRNLADDCEQFCWDMLDKAGVAFTPGTDFGSHDARHHVRFSYTEPLHRLEEAIERLSKVL